MNTRTNPEVVRGAELRTPERVWRWIAEFLLDPSRKYEGSILVICTSAAIRRAAEDEFLARTPPNGLDLQWLGSSTGIVSRRVEPSRNIQVFFELPGQMLRGRNHATAFIAD